jgi:hypothetical protein
MIGHVDDESDDFDDDPDREEERCIGAACLHHDPFHLPSECFTAEMAAAAMGGLTDVTYRREQLEGLPHASLAIWTNGALAGRLTVRVDEIELLSVLEQALAESGARESEP